MLSSVCRFYLHPPGTPGGKVINASAFTTPVPAAAQGNLGRNNLRGFGATQWDLTLRRQFRFTDHFSLQARGDFFNILNHPKWRYFDPTNRITPTSAVTGVKGGVKPGHRGGVKVGQ